MLLRIGDLRGLDLNLFDFDYDLPWHALMFTAEGQMLGRFGGRDATTPGKYQTLPGLRFALEQALERHRKLPVEKSSKVPARHAENYPAARYHPQRSCVHCHHVHEWQRAEAQEKGTWTKNWEWKYPDPGLIGLTMDLEQQNKVAAVAQESGAQKIGLTKGDVLSTVNQHPVASIADLQFALDRAPTVGSIPLTWRRDGKAHTGELRLPPLWKMGDVSWRWSLKSLKPDPPVRGEDLTALEKKTLGLAPDHLAFRQSGFLTTAARQAGVQINDVIVGLENRGPFHMTARQFEAFFRMNCKAGETADLEIMRNGKKMRVSLKIP